MDLIGFLRARLDDEVALAEAAALTARAWITGDTDAEVPGIPGHRDVWVCDAEHGMDWPLAEMLNGSIMERRSAARHIARWDPARVLAEVEAKRAVLNELERILPVSLDPMTPAGIVALAQPYADHPDFDPAWLACSPGGV